MWMRRKFADANNQLVSVLKSRFYLHTKITKTKSIPYVFTGELFG